MEKWWTVTMLLSSMGIGFSVQRMSRRKKEEKSPLNSKEKCFWHGGLLQLIF